MADMLSNGVINYPYTAIELTEEVNRIPNVWTDLGDEGLFGAETAQYPTTTMVEIQIQDSVVTVLEADERGNPGPEAAEETRNGIFFKIPHIPFTARIKPDDLQDRWVFESGRKRLMTLADATSRRLLQIRRNHAQTLELLKWGALKGQIVTGRGRVLYDLYKAFGIKQKVFDLKLGDAGTDVEAICEDIREYLETHLLGETMTGIRAKLSTDLWRRFTRHPSVEKYYIQHTGALQLLSGIEQRRFSFGTIEWEPNYHVVSNIDRKPVKFLDDNSGIVYPAGTEDTFRTYFGPANTIEGANVVGTDVFVSPEVLKHGQGVEFYSQSNPLPLCIRPELLVAVGSSN